MSIKTDSLNLFVSTSSKLAPSVKCQLFLKRFMGFINVLLDIRKLVCINKVHNNTNFILTFPSNEIKLQDFEILLNEVLV